MFSLCISAELSLVHERASADILPVQREVPIIATVSERSISHHYEFGLCLFFLSVISGEKTCAFSALFPLLTGSFHLVLNSY